MDFKFFKKQEQTQMEIEILAQPNVVGALIDKYVQNYVVTVDMPSDVKNIKVISSGSSYHCALIAKKFFEEIAAVEMSVEYSGEFLCAKEKMIDPQTLYFFISQSGETYDTVSAARAVKEAGAKTYAVVNNNDSTLYNLCDYKINVNSGVENSIAATKSFTTSLCALYLCAIKIAQNKLKDVAPYLKDINEIEKNMTQTIDSVQNIDKAADLLHKYPGFCVIGQGINFAIAKEAALKMRETSYIDVNAHSMGEFLHGHVAVLNNINTLVEIITHDFCEFETKTISKIKKDYNPKSVVITDVKDDFDAKVSLVFPRCENKLATVLNVVLVAQMLALKVALKLKRNVDTPHGLSKVVGE